MNSGPEYYELIERYLKGQLSELEKRAFEKRMKEDPSFSEEMTMQKTLDALIFEKGLADIRKKVGEDMTPPPSPSIKKPLLVSLFGILVTAGILYFYWETNQEQKDLSTKRSFTEEASRVSETSNVEESNSIKKMTKPSPKSEEKVFEQKQPVSGLYTVPQIRTEDESYPTHEKVTPAPSVIPDKTEKALSGNEEEKTEKPQREVQRESNNIPCPVIEFEVKTEKACKNKPTGSIEIVRSGIYGGKEPYSYAVDGKDSGDERIFNELYAGKYKISVMDSKGCVTEKEFLILEKVCIEYKDYSFHPETESWTLPFSEHESGTITVTTKNGKIVYTAEIVNGYPDSWNGRSQSGELLSTGTYVYVAQTGKGEIRQGYIVILH